MRLAGGVHLHPRDDGFHVRPLEIEVPHGLGQSAADGGFRRGFVYTGDLCAPFFQARPFLRDGQLAVGDIVDLPAEGVEREHRLPPRGRQQAHRPIE